MYVLKHTTTGATLGRGTRKDCAALEAEIRKQWPGIRVTYLNIGHGYVGGTLRRAQRRITAIYGRRSQSGLSTL